jgi:Uma2 family endonuclease
MKAFGDEYWVRPQMSLHLEPRSAPEPDAAVILGTPDDIAAKPTSALLVVEVSDATLVFDRRRKMGLYARNGIADYWIVNLHENCLEIYRSPIRDRSQPFGFRYSSIDTLTLNDVVSLIAQPRVAIAVSELLPPKR